MISINATLIIQIINLLVLLAVLNRIMIKPIRKIMKKRQQELTEGQTEADAMHRKAEDGYQTYQGDLKKGRASVREKLAGLKILAEKDAMAVIKQAHDEAKVREAELQERIQEELRAARGDIKQQAHKVAVSMAGALLDREVS